MNESAYITAGLSNRHMFCTKEYNIGKEDPIIGLKAIAALFGVPDYTYVALAGQVHENNVLIVEAPGVYFDKNFDAIVTSTPGIAIGVRTADCVPILLESTCGSVVGAVHAGWRGAVSGVIENTITAMMNIANSDIRAAIGPSIRKNSYEVGKDLLDAFIKARTMYEVGHYFEHKVHDKYMFDLVGFCQDILKSNSILEVTDVGVDTVLDNKRFFSYRRDTLRSSKLEGCQFSGIMKQ